MSDKIKQLEKLAIEAHRTGQGWQDFTTQHSEAIKTAEPVNISRYRRLRANLVALVVSGDRDGMFAAGDDDAIYPWEAAEQYPPAGG